VDDSLLTVVEALHAEPRPRSLCPFPTHGTPHFLLVAPPPWPEPDGERLPVHRLRWPPYKVRVSGYADLLGEAERPAEGATLVVNHPPPEQSASSSRHARARIHRYDVPLPRRRNRITGCPGS
jgi:hypothetical protein